MTEILLLGILVAQILILLRTPRPEDPYKRRQRRQKIERIKAKVNARFK